MKDYVVFEDDTNYIKKDNIILSKNFAGLQDYKNRKKEREDLRTALDEINKLKEEIKSIKKNIGMD